jgi:hypothetical protein
MKNWTQALPQDTALVDAEQFNDEYDTHKGTFNGGIDRTAANAAWCNRTHLKANALHAVTLDALTANDQFVYQPSGSSLTNFGCVQYNQYGGGWVNSNITQTISDCHEGFLHVEIAGNFFINQEFADTESQKVKLRLLLNGIPVAAAGYFVQSMMSFRFTADVPIISGINELLLQWRMNGKNSAVGVTDAMFHLFGVRLLSIPRWR